MQVSPGRTRTPLQPESPSGGYDGKRIALRRKRALATGLLLVAVVLFLGMRLVPEPGLGLRLLNAAAEAAIVGGLADWFAITALFRRPLGLPIPHTALIPSRKDEIGRSLGDFVSGQFLDQELLTERLRRENRALQIANWLDTPKTADFVAERIVAIVPILLNGLDDAEIRTFTRTLAREGISRIQIVPTVDALLESFVATGKHMEIVDVLIAVIAPSLQALKEPIVERVGERTGRFFPSYFDRKIGKGIVDGTEKWLDSVRTPASEERLRVDIWLRTTVREFRASPDYPKLLEQAQMEIASNPAVLHALGMVWDRMKSDLLADAGAASPRISIVSADIVRTIGRLLRQMPVMQDYLNTAIERMLVDYIAPWRIQIGNYIAETIGSWDGHKVAETVELQVGSDLQYIRINGTLVGALIGAALFLIGVGLASL